MESTGIQRLFYLSWTVIKLNLLFVLFSLAGGIIFGVGPALQMMTDFILEEGMNYQAITVNVVNYYIYFIFCFPNTRYFLHLYATI